MAKISKKDVKRTASLAKLDLSNKEVEKFNSQLKGVLDNFSSVDKVKTDGIEISAQVTGLEDVMVRDSSEHRINIDREQQLKNVPISENDYIVVPKVL